MSLKDLGAIFHLGHNHGISCAVPSSPIPLTLFDITGVHTINITYCECNPDGLPPRVQLLRVRWFPATWQRPSTAFTLRLLNFLHKLQSTCKVNLYDFHNAITTVFDNAGLGKPLVSVCSTIPHDATNIMCSSGTTSFLWCSASTCIYVNSGGVAAHILLADCRLFQKGTWPSSARHVRTPAGTLYSRRMYPRRMYPRRMYPRRMYSTRDHRTCSLFTVYLLEGLTTTCPFSMFETLYLSMDANFKLKQKERGFIDPPLANGFAYMVSNEKLHEHLANCKDTKVLQDEVNLSLLMCL